MTVHADRIETLVKQRIEQNNHDRSDGPRLAGARFRPLQISVDSGALGQDYQRQNWALRELLQYYDRQFIQNAYLVLLKRDADVEGLTGRLRLLRNGAVSRLELLFRLRYGPEGKQYKTRVRGLVRAFAFERLCRIPVIGLIPAYLRALVFLPRMQRDIEELRGLLARYKNELDGNDQSIVDFQNEHLAKIIRSLHRQ